MMKATELLFESMKNQRDYWEHMAVEMRKARDEIESTHEELLRGYRNNLALAWREGYDFRHSLAWSKLVPIIAIAKNSNPYNITKEKSG